MYCILLEHLRNTTSILDPRCAQLQQLAKVRGTETSNRIPPLCSVPRRAWNDWTTIRRDVESAETVASSALAGRDVVQAKLANGVNPWVQESQRWEVG